MTVAAVLLAEATFVVALAIGTGWLLGPAAVVALVSGIAATRIVVAELAQARRDAAREHAQQALDYRELSARTAAEHVRFATVMTERFTDREQVIARLRRALRAALRRADEADERARVEAVKAAGLSHQVDQLQLALGIAAPDDNDELAIWEGSQAPTVVDLVAWDQRSADAAAEAGEDWRERA